MSHFISTTRLFLDTSMLHTLAMFPLLYSPSRTHREPTSLMESSHCTTSMPFSV